MFYSTLAECFAITVSIFYARRFLDKRSFVSLGLVPNKQAILDILVGIGITFTMMAFIFILALGMGWITFDGFAWQSDGYSLAISQSLIWLFIFVIVGWQEELLSRGYLLQNLRDGMTLFWGVMLSSLVFAIFHLFNPGTTWVSTMGIFLAGLFLAFGYVMTKQLWLPIGLHIGWNLFEGVIFGFPVSGMNPYALVRLQIPGPSLWTGGTFGPEAGLLLIPGLLLGVGLVYYYSRFLRVKNV
jgi:uncharacterized protein